MIRKSAILQAGVPQQPHQVECMHHRCAIQRRCRATPTEIYRGADMGACASVHTNGLKGLNHASVNSSRMRRGRTILDERRVPGRASAPMSTPSRTPVPTPKHALGVRCVRIVDRQDIPASSMRLTGCMQGL
ncbi:hypothetical protein AK830_g6602 [Neonectria ditissima]|uniref:Uncharacterized protein n=1 Tax=Neonectria ditissima TaxID=78410 RepID=A0A0P7AQ47_9HYPO|nr:hypothetical protein AK830_g6602 [Neonectria ditissima]